jgi:hypothetical protein
VQQAEKLRCRKLMEGVKKRKVIRQEIGMKGWQAGKKSKDSHNQNRGTLS